MEKDNELAQSILDTALRLAEQSTWEAIRLYDVARGLNLSLAEVYEHYRQKDDLAEAWFDRADRAMLVDVASPEYLLLSGGERIHRSIMVWLNTLAEHRRITGEMLLYKLEIGHIHLQVLGIMRISRTVQWVLESAHQEATYSRRVLEEVTVTSIYLATFVHWLRDDSPASNRTSQLLDNFIRAAEKWSRFLPSPRQTSTMHSGNKSSSSF